MGELRLPFIPFYMEDNPRIKWWEPFQHSRLNAWTELKQSGILRPVFWVRVIGLCAVLIGLLIVFLLLIFPGSWVPWQRLFLGMFVMPVVLLFNVGLLILIPRHIDIRRNGIQIANGQHNSSIRAADIRSIELVDLKNTESRLKIDYVTRRGRQRKIDFAVSAKVDRRALERLVSHLCLEAKKHPKA